MTQPEYVVPDNFCPPGRPKYPKGISPEAKAAFKRLVRFLEERKSLTAGDRELLELYALLYDRATRARKMLAEQGEIRVYIRLDRHGDPVPTEKSNLWLAVAENAEAKMIACLDRLGLTPLNRSKVRSVSAPKPAPTEDQLYAQRIMDRQRTETSEPTPEPISIDDIDLEKIQ